MATAILTHTLMMIMMMSPLLHVNGMETNNGRKILSTLLAIMHASIVAANFTACNNYYA